MKTPTMPAATSTQNGNTKGSIVNPNNSSISGSGNPTIAMTCAAPEGTPPRRISVYKHICRHRTAPPCLGEALRRGALIKLRGLMIFRVRV